MNRGRPGKGGPTSDIPTGMKPRSAKSANHRSKTGKQED